MNKEELDKYLELQMLQVALDSMGIYPTTVVKPDGTKEQRTEFQEGWNEAITSLISLWTTSTKSINYLTPYIKQELSYLIDAGVICFDKEDNGYFVSLSDTFSYASADGEDVKPDELPVLAELHKIFDYDGIVAWAAIKRKTDPIKERITENFLLATNYILSNRGLF